MSPMILVLILEFNANIIITKHKILKVSVIVKHNVGKKIIKIKVEKEIVAKFPL